MNVQPGERGPISVVTRMNFAAEPLAVWEGLMFFEHISRPPPLPLRLLLPVPIGTEGRKSQVGDEITCRYRFGHLLKRVTEVETGRRYAFDIAEQHLAVGRGIRLRNGSYALHALPAGGTEVELETCYESPRHPRWLWKPIEAAVCHGFHRHILNAMRREIESREPIA